MSRMIRQADHPYKGWRPGRLVAPPFHIKTDGWVRQTHIHDFIPRMISGLLLLKWRVPASLKFRVPQTSRYDFQTYLVVAFSIFISFSDIIIALQWLAA